MQKNIDKSTKHIVYFNSSGIDKSLNILDEELESLSLESNDYRELLVNVFNVKEADIHNIILHEYLPWFIVNRSNRNVENDTLLISKGRQVPRQGFFSTNVLSDPTCCEPLRTCRRPGRPSPEMGGSNFSG